MVACSRWVEGSVQQDGAVVEDTDRIVASVVPCEDGGMSVVVGKVQEEEPVVQNEFLVDRSYEGTVVDTA